MAEIKDCLSATIDKRMQETKPKDTIRVDELMTRMMVVYRLGISERTYNRWVKAGILVPIQLGNKHYYREQDLEAALKRSIEKGLK